MRITKKWLREAKERLHQRTRQLLLMNDSEVRAEHLAIYPHRRFDLRGGVDQQRRELLYQAIEDHIPSHLVD